MLLFKINLRDLRDSSCLHDEPLLQTLSSRTSLVHRNHELRRRVGGPGVSALALRQLSKDEAFQVIRLWNNEEDPMIAPLHPLFDDRDARLRVDGLVLHDSRA